MSRVVVGSMVGVLTLALLACGSPKTRHTYHVTEEQLHKMGEIAHIPPCPAGPTIVAAVKRKGGGGLVHVECPGFWQEGR